VLLSPYRTNNSTQLCLNGSVRRYSNIISYFFAALTAINVARAINLLGLMFSA
jgi:hypothetical protein